MNRRAIQEAFEHGFRLGHQSSTAAARMIPNPRPGSERPSPRDSTARWQTYTDSLERRLRDAEGQATLFRRAVERRDAEVERLREEAATAQEWATRCEHNRIEVERLRRRLDHVHDEVIPSYRAKVEALRESASYWEAKYNGIVAAARAQIERLRGSS